MAMQVIMQTRRIVVVVLKTRLNERWLGYPASSGSNALCGINRTSVAAFSIGSNTMEHWKN